MMNFKHILLATALMGLSACATTAPTPVDNSLINSLKFSAVNVKFAEDRSIPTVYDNAVKTLIDTGEPDTSAAIKSFMAYVDANGGSGTENDRLAERYLEYRIAEEVKFGLSTSLNGTKPIDVLINVEKVQTPNAATMLLVGEVKGIEYDLDVVNSETKEVVLDLSKSSSPFVERSVGAGGGLLGMALRSGKNTNLTDLEQLASAVAVEVRQILLGPMVNKTVRKKIRIAESED